GDDRRPLIWGLVHGHHAHVAAVTAAHDDDLFGIDIARLLDPVRGGQYVLQITAAHVEQVGVLKFFSIAGGAAIIGGDHDIALVGHVLHETVEGVHGLRRGPAVNQNDGGMLAVARQVIRYVNERRDGPVAILA